MTTTTMMTAEPSEVSTSSIEAWMNLVEFVGDLHLHRWRQVALELGHQRAHALDQGKRVARRGRLDADEHGVLAVHRDTRCPALRREIDGGDVSHPHQRAALGLDHHVLELRDIGQPGVGADVGDREIALRLTRRRLVVIGLDRSGDIIGRDPARRHSSRIEPQPHRKRLASQNIRRGHAIDRVEQWLDHSCQIIRNCCTRYLIARKADIHDRCGLSCRLDDNRVLRTGRQQVFDLLNFSHDFGQRLVWVEVEQDIGGDRAGALNRRGSQVVDPLRRSHRLGDRRRNKALHQIGRGAGI